MAAFGYEYVIVPPATVTTFDEQKKPVLYSADGKPLVRRPAGFDTSTPKGSERCATAGGSPGRGPSESF